MRPYQASRSVRSIVYRRKLLEELPELEATLTAYVSVTNTRYLAGYELAIENDQLILRKLEPLEWQQLRLKLEGTSQSSLQDPEQVPR